jgi:hypothetical protein
MTKDRCVVTEWAEREDGSGDLFRCIRERFHEGPHVHEMTVVMKPLPDE